VFGSTDDDRNMGMGVVIEYENRRGDPRWTSPPKEPWDYTCVYRKLKPGRNDGEAHRGSGVNEWFRSVESDEKLAHLCLATDAF
jgi:hypothetical protein